MLLIYCNGTDSMIWFILNLIEPKIKKVTGQMLYKTLMEISVEHKFSLRVPLKMSVFCLKDRK